jgi:esterase
MTNDLKIKFNILEKGDPTKTCVILLHGLLGSARNLMRLQDKIAQAGYYVLAYDQRGHGRTEIEINKNQLSTSNSQYNLSTLALDVLEVMNQKQIKKAHLVGHSMGGRVSIIAASQHQERFKTVSILDVSPKISEKATLTLKNILEPLPLSFSSKIEAEKFLKENLKLDLETKKAFEGFLLSSLKDVNGVFQWIFDLEGIRNSLFLSILENQLELYKKINIPILILRGERSQHFEQEEAEKMLKENSNASLKIIPNAGHWLHVDNLESTASEIINFINYHEH